MVELHQAVAALLSSAVTVAVACRRRTRAPHRGAACGPAGEAFPDAAAFVLQESSSIGAAGRHAVPSRRAGSTRDRSSQGSRQAAGSPRYRHKMPVLQLAGLPVEHHQAGAVAPLQRCSCDEPCGRS